MPFSLTGVILFRVVISFTAQVPDVLFSLVNLARLNLARTLLGPIQGQQIDAELRLDFLCVNADAAPPSPMTNASPLQPQKQLPTATGNAFLDKGSKPINGGRYVSRATHVPYHKLPQVKQQVRSSSKWITCMLQISDGNRPPKRH